MRLGCRCGRVAGRRATERLGSLGAVFTGIVREVGVAAAISGAHDGVRLEIEAPETAAVTAVGDSVSIDGVCLTVVAVGAGRLAFDAVPETLARTSLGGLAAGAPVNVEPALRAGEPLGGHYVQGHVDGVGVVRSVEDEGDGRRIWIDAPPRPPSLRRREGLDRRPRREPHGRRRSTRTASRSP